MSDELSIDYLEDPRAKHWKDNLERVTSNLSAFHSYENGEMTKETGPSLLVVQVDNSSVDQFATTTVSNAFSEPEDPVYMDEDIATLYDLFWTEASEDDAQAIFGNGRVFGKNSILDPDNYRDDETDVNPEHSAKHTFAARTSQEDNVVYALALSGESGDITTFVDGKQREAPIKREDLIEEVEDGDADWVIQDRIEHPSQYEWIDIEEELE